MTAAEQWNTVDDPPKLSARARALLEGWRVDLTGLQSAYFGVRGEWYQAPKAYPTILVWPRGFKRFETEDELRNCEGVRLTKQVNVRKGGIATLVGYVLCEKEV